MFNLSDITVKQITKKIAPHMHLITRLFVVFYSQKNKKTPSVQFCPAWRLGSHLGNHGHNGDQRRQLSHHSNFLSLEVVRVDEEEASVNPHVFDCRHGHTPLRVLLVCQVSSVLGSDVVQDAGTGMAVVQPRCVLQQANPKPRCIECSTRTLKPRCVLQQANPKPRCVLQQANPKPRCVMQPANPKPRCVLQQANPKPRYVLQQAKDGC